MPKIQYLPISTWSPDQVSRELMRRHHWRRYFECCRVQDDRQAAYHKTLAQSIKSPSQGEPPPSGEAYS